MKTKEIKQLIQQDNAGAPADAVKQRLDHAFMLKSSSYAVRQNSFSGFFSWLFSFQSFGFKTALAGVIISFMLFNQSLTINPTNSISLDSIQVTQSLQIDSSLFNNKAINDSIIL